MDSTIIYILAIILLLLLALNNITIITNPIINHPLFKQANCSQTTFGCCPDGVNSKVNFYGTNCPGYKLDPGYPLMPGPGPVVGGCSGTRYGCCLDNITPKINDQGSNCLLH